MFVNTSKDTNVKILNAKGHYIVLYVRTEMQQSYFSE